MVREAGKGSKPRPYSVNQDTFSNNWNLIFGDGMKKQPIKLINPLNKETWLCDDFSNVKLVDGVEYVTVHKPDTPSRTHLMRKDALRKQ
jgi:hypothetical protein